MKILQLCNDKSQRPASDHSTIFARWRQQFKNKRVTLGFVMHFKLCRVLQRLTKRIKMHIIM